MAYFNKAHGVTLPTSTIQGREFLWVIVDANVDIETSYGTIGSNFQKLITALQQVAEMHVIGYPSGTYVTIALSLNTTPGAPQEWADSSISALETAIDDATGWSVNVWDGKLNGDTFSYD
jgi:hypothetical protein